MTAQFGIIVRVALALGLLIDAGVGLIAIFAQPLIQPLFELPVKDPAMTSIAGGELVVAACIYALALRDPARNRPLLWLCALDQTIGVLIPAWEIMNGHVPGTFKTIAPMPFQLALVAIYIVAARRRGSPAP